MPEAASRQVSSANLVTMARAATAAVEALLADATVRVGDKVILQGRPVGRLMDREQRATHGLAWLATYVEAVRQLAAYAERMDAEGRLSEIEDLLVRIGLFPCELNWTISRSCSSVWSWKTSKASTAIGLSTNTGRTGFGRYVIEALAAKASQSGACVLVWF